MKRKSSHRGFTQVFDQVFTEVFGEPNGLPTTGEDLRQEFELKKPIVQRGELKEPPTKVNLNPRQAEELRKSGVI